MKTPKQSKHITAQCIKLYGKIVAFKKQFGHPPSLREMCKLMDINSTSHVRGYVCVLENWHWIEVDGGRLPMPSPCRKRPVAAGLTCSWW